MNSSSARRLVVEGGGRQVVGHAGLHALARFADTIGVGAALSPAVPWTGERAPFHDRGKVLVHAMLMLAGGGEACSDIEQLRVEDRLFGEVASDSTLYRTMTGITPATLDSLRTAFAGVRHRMWTEHLDTGRAVVLDVDSSLVQIHSENKDQTAPTFKGGFGFHPMFCFADLTGETLAARLRPGNAGANTITDLLQVVDDAITQLPAEVGVGHRNGDAADTVQRRVQVRADSAGGTQGFVAGLRARNIGFAVVARTNAQIHAALSKIAGQPARWTKAIRRAGDPAQRSAVAEITDLVDLTGWPEGTRLIIRRERLHEGAQRSLLPDMNYRYWGHFTDTAEGTPAELDHHMRAHAHVEDHIKRLKDAGLERFPFTSINANRAWLTLIGMAADLVAWFQRVCLTGSLATAEAKQLRWQFWHAPARLIRTGRQEILRIIEHWPRADELLAAHQRINLLAA